MIKKKGPKKEGGIERVNGLLSVCLPARLKGSLKDRRGLEGGKLRGGGWNRQRGKEGNLDAEG